jgi:hypothetical protein
MAFNHHLESDSVGEIGFFNFVRAPIGLVLWALGGNHDEDVCRRKDEIEQETEDQRQSIDNLRRFSDNISGSRFHKGSPSMVRSEVSDMSTYQHEYLQERMAAVHLNLQQASSCSVLKKKLSWSDENGENLAFEVSCYDHRSLIRMVDTEPHLLFVESFGRCSVSPRD